jgi:hypothetical protein
MHRKQRWAARSVSSRTSGSSWPTGADIIVALMRSDSLHVSASPNGCKHELGERAGFVIDHISERRYSSTTYFGTTIDQASVMISRISS